MGELINEKDLARIPHLISDDKPRVVVINIHPYQTYMPKISSRVTDNGMESNPLHLMTPKLNNSVSSIVLKYINEASIHFRNEEDVAEFLLIAGE